MGFKTEQFVKSVDENLFCSICHEVFEDPVSCKDGHSFCRDCIHEWLKTNNICPLQGNGYISKQNLVPQFTIKGIIDNLEVYCHPLGVEDFELKCDWVGKLQHLTQHRKTCPFQEVKCSHVKCNQTIQRRELEHHKKICDFRYVACDKCELVLYQRDKEKHMKDDCLQGVILCPNECKDKQRVVTQMKRADLNKHINDICPKTLVSCPFNDQGCSVEVERYYVDVHVQDNMAAHMVLVAKQYSLLTKQNSTLSKQNTTLTEENTALAERCSALEEESSKLNHMCLLLAGKIEHLQEEVNQVRENCSFKWTIDDFPTLTIKHGNGSAFTSPIFWLCGHKLCFFAYPNGVDKDSEGWLSLFLNFSVEYPKFHKFIPKIPNVNNAIAVVYRLSVESTKSGIEDFSHESTYSFKEPGNWGWHKFMKTTEALSGVYCNSNNRLTITIQSTKVPDKVMPPLETESETDEERSWEWETVPCDWDEESELGSG